MNHEDAQRILDNLTILQESVVNSSQCMEDMMTQYQNYLENQNDDLYDDEKGLELTVNTLLDTLLGLQKHSDLIKEEFNKATKQIVMPPLNNSFPIYCENQMIEIIRDHMNKIVNKINQYAPEFGVDQIIPKIDESIVEPQISSQQSMDIENDQFQDF